MSDDELAKLEALANAATPAPWRVVADSCLAIAADEGSIAIDFYERDADFIVAARDAVPALVAEVRWRRKEVARLRAVAAQMLANEALALFDESDER